uniref:Uncharacterized protein n=1 Tax=Arundo donax TaxID=35708 RepID=A0A0A8ZMT9_ARUDO
MNYLSTNLAHQTESSLRETELYLRQNGTLEIPISKYEPSHELYMTHIL